MIGAFISSRYSPLTPIQLYNFQCQCLQDIDIVGSTIDREILNSWWTAMFTSATKAGHHLLQFDGPLEPTLPFCMYAQALPWHVNNVVMGVWYQNRLSSRAGGGLLRARPHFWKISAMARAGSWPAPSKMAPTSLSNIQSYLCISISHAQKNAIRTATMHD